MYLFFGRACETANIFSIDAIFCSHGCRVTSANQLLRKDDGMVENDIKQLGRGHASHITATIEGANAGEACPCRRRIVVVESISRHTCHGCSLHISCHDVRIGKLYLAYIFFSHLSGCILR